MASMIADRQTIEALLELAALFEALAEQLEKQRGPGG
jgi:hypothetical protein